MTKKFNSRFNRRIIKHSLNIIILSMVIASISAVATCSAAAPNGGWWQTVQEGGLNRVGQAYGGGEPRDIRMAVVDIIKIILGFLGIIAVVLIIWAGFKWMLSRGNEEEVAAAKRILTAGVIGLVIILSAYVIANFIIKYIYGATTGEPVFWL